VCVRDGLLSVPFSSVVVVRCWCLASGSAFRSASPLLLCLLARGPVYMLSVYDWLQLGRKASLSFAKTPTVSMYLLSGSLRVFFPSISVVSGFLAPGLFLTRLLGPMV
jgi:hypothetical protein